MPAVKGPLADTKRPSMNFSDVKSLGLCPLKQELQGLVSGLEAQGHVLEVIQKNQYWCSELSLMLAIGGHGKAEFAARGSAHLVALNDCERLLCLGSAGSLTEKVHALDVIIASHTLEHDYNEKFGSNIKKPIFKSEFTQSHFESINYSINQYGFAVYYSQIASGDEDIVSSARASELNTMGPIAVAWEGAGGARAARNLDKGFIEIRGISDCCNDDTASHFWENLPKTMDNVSKVLSLLLRHI